MTRLLSLAVALPLFLFGCSAPPTARPVTGKVLVDQVPMAEGEASFSRPGEAPVILQVKSGAFAGVVPLGKCRVELRSFREAPPPPGAPRGAMVNVLPAKFNTASTLTAEVRGDGPNEFSFSIQSK